MSENQKRIINQLKLMQDNLAGNDSITTAK